ncbi:uncharacterized [Tachysurus ichikawai]
MERKTLFVELSFCFQIRFSEGRKPHLIPQQPSLPMHGFYPSDFGQRKTASLTTYRNKVALNGSSPSPAHKSEEMFACWRKRREGIIYFSFHFKTTERFSVLLSRAAV